MDAITTIQLHEGVKRTLDKLKASNESYEDAILKLLDSVEKQKRKQTELIIEGYKEMAEESLKICEEFKFVDREVEEKYGS